METVETPELNIFQHTNILNALQGDGFLRSKQEIHVMRLKEELQELRRKGLGAGGRTCARCRAELGRIINRGAFCRACRYRVCKSCREYCNRQPTEWLCTVCHKHMELAAATGDWMNEFVHHPDKRGNKINAETIKHSIQRSWTFSDSSPSPWMALRGSPEMRAYSSMPRHQDCEFITRTFTSIVQPSVKLASESSSKEDENKNSETQSDVEKQDNSNDSESDRVLSDIELKVPNEIVKASSDVESSMLTSSGGEQSSVSSSPMVDKRTSILESSLASPVLRKVTLKKRRIDSRNLPPGVTPPRSRRHLRQNQGNLEDEMMNSFLESGRILVPDGEDYKLVFISSSDSSSREELQSDDASSTSSGLVAGSHLEDCDWDYFEAAAGPIKPIVKDWSWVGGGESVSGSGGGGGVGGVGVGGGGGNDGQGQGRAVVAAHRAASQQSASARTVNSSASSSSHIGVSAVLPIPVPIPVPVPFLVPVPWNPELTIRVQHSLAPLWRDLLHHGGLAMTEEKSRAENMPASEVNPVDELLCNKAVSEVIVQQETECDKDGGVVLTMYKSLDESNGSAVWESRKSVPETIERNDDSSASSTCSEDDESDPPKRKAIKRIYRFNNQQRDSGSEEEEENDSLGEFSIGVTPPKSISSSGESSDEYDGKHFSKMYVVNDKERKGCDIPGLNSDNDDDVGSGIALIKHVQVEDGVIDDENEESSNAIDKKRIDSSEIKLSHILNPKVEEKPDVIVKGSNDSGCINLKTVLGDVTCGKTGSDSAVNGIKCQNNPISFAPGDLRALDRVDLEPVSGSECVTSLDADSLSVGNTEPVVLISVHCLEDEDVSIELVSNNNNNSKINNEKPEEEERCSSQNDSKETFSTEEIDDISNANDVVVVKTVQNIFSHDKESKSPTASESIHESVPVDNVKINESNPIIETVEHLESSSLNTSADVDSLKTNGENICSYLENDLAKNETVLACVENNLLNNDLKNDITVNLEQTAIGKKNVETNFVKCDVEPVLCNQDSDADSDSKMGQKIVEEGTRSSTSDEFSGTESMELNVNAKEECSRAKEEGQLTAAVPGESWRETGRYTSLVMITQDTPQQPTATVLHSPQPATCDQVHIVTGADTLSCLEEGLADDDSWVEDLDREDIDREELNTTTEESSEGEDATFPDREEELRGYHRTAIDFTLHTIVEESCEESEVEQEKNKPTELEKYFVYGLGDGTNEHRETDTMSETSSIYSEGLESISGDKEQIQDDSNMDPADLASSRLEKYFLTEFMGFSRRDSDGSVGSDSEGRPSPEQRRKRLVRARGTGRLHSSSLDNLLAESEQQVEMQVESEGSSTETDSHDETGNSFEKTDGQFDTVKRTKKKKRSVVSAPSLELLETPEKTSREEGDSTREEGSVTPQPELLPPPAAADLATSRNKQQSRDSGFMGSCDDLLKESSGANSEPPQEEPPAIKPEAEKKDPVSVSLSSAPPTAGLSRKDSFNNWSSDEETNLMMSKMRAFFKTMVGTQPKASNPNARTRSKPPQLVYFESELTRLMKTVPGIRDEQVKEIVEYLSSEDTWSDSYDSSDYTSSDLEGACKKSALQEQISASCRQIISKFENGSSQEPQEPGLNRDTALVYHRLVASFSKMETPSSDSSSHSSPPLIAKVMQHIGSRLVALMHEVSGGEGGPASPKSATRLYHRRLQPKLSATSTTEEEEDSMEDYSPLPRSKSHDPLLEASDNERFSWRGSFESALMAGSDSRTRLESSGAASKRRSASDLLLKSCSRDQLDRVRSCGSIGGSVEDKIWGLRHPKRRRSSVPDSGGSADGEEDSEEERTQPATNSLPRLPTTAAPSPSPSIYKAHSVHQFNNVKSARYRPPGRSPAPTLAPPPRRNATDNARRNRNHQSTASSPACPPAALASSDDGSICSEPVGLGRNVEEDVDRLINQHRASLGARSDSLASVYSGAGEGRYGSVTVRGEVEFGLQYNYKQGALEIHIKQCKDLAPVDTKRNRSDPYVKVYLLPDKSKSGKRKTRVKKHTLNPVFEETLKFHITLEGLESRTLWLSVWHSDMFGRNDFLGEVTMSLENKVFDDPLPRFYTLQERTEPLDELLSSKGELIVGLKFIPPESLTGKKRSKGALHVLVKEAKNLTAVKSNGLSDPFCKSYLLPDKMRSSKQKTPVLRRTCHPAWNHTFTYHDVGLAELSERSLELTIWDHDRLASNEFLGGVRLNLGSGKHYGKSVDWMDSSGKEVLLWQWMMERPNLWVESCLQLRPSLDVRSNS